MKNECGKTRPVDNPYEVWSTPDGSWTWRILKHYQAPDKEKVNPFARVLCAVYSPITRAQMSSGYELGDVYIRDITNVAQRVNQVFS
jgi:hypothetical protein